MPRDIVELVEGYLTDDQTRWGRLSSDIQYRRAQLLLLREILLELREINAKLDGAEGEEE